ncbi:MAG TPA: CaiB/BaiF CoA-transferase family protein [Cyclobacteriaceae bacterium]|nr:CaiB/BaiF CoA-transferase family protein [Cyclobacteriaceae bacterium]
MFTGLRVVELASVLAGPSVGQFFAELGAVVIKVENLKSGGDVTRSWRSAGERTDDRSAYFCSCNWGKKSVAVDLTTRDGKEAVARLIQQADLVIASYKPGDAEKLGVAYTQWRDRHPRLIYGQITGYGHETDRVGYDAVVQAEAGFMDLNGTEDGPPTKMPVALVDVLAAHQLKEGLLLALLHRERTGKGSCVEVSLLDAALASLVNQGSNWLVGGNQPRRQGSAHPNIAPYGDSFATRDGALILLAVGNDKQFGALCMLLDISGLIANPAYQTNEGRVRNRAELTRQLSEAIGKRSSAEFLSALHSRKIPAGKIQTIPEALSMPHARKLMVHNDGLRGLRSLVARSSAWSERDLSYPPHLGEHTNEVLGAL